MFIEYHSNLNYLCELALAYSQRKEPIEDVFDSVFGSSESYIFPVQGIKLMLGCPIESIFQIYRF